MLAYLPIICEGHHQLRRSCSSCTNTRCQMVCQLAYLSKQSLQHLHMQVLQRNSIEHPTIRQGVPTVDLPGVDLHVQHPTSTMGCRETPALIQSECSMWCWQRKVLGTQMAVPKHSYDL